MTSVLLIGDSHTGGPFGERMHTLLRGAGFDVLTVASWGSGPGGWFRGFKTKKLVARGTSPEPLVRENVDTPLLRSLLEEKKPDVVLIALGANIRGNAPAVVAKDSSALARIAAASGARVIWIGPPRGPKDDRDDLESLHAFDTKLSAVLRPVPFVSSAELLPKYAGKDGIHYNNAEGTLLATQWADRVFRTISDSLVPTSAALVPAASAGSTGGPSKTKVAVFLGVCAAVGLASWYAPPAFNPFGDPSKQRWRR